MTDENKNMNAEVIAVYPNKVKIDQRQLFFPVNDN